MAGSNDLRAFDMPDAYYFDGGRFEPRTGRLVHDGIDVRLRPKTAGVLAMLLARPGELVSKVELLDRIWGGAAGDEVVTVCIAELRRALHEPPRGHRLIDTVHRRGYRFRVSVSTAPPEGVGRLSALVGRAPALVVLTGWWESASAGERTTGFVAGEAGAGKTALVHAFLDEVRRRDVVAIGEGRCADRNGAEPYLPFLDVLTSLCRGTNGSRFQTLLRELAPSWAMQLPGVTSGDAVDGVRQRSAGSSPGRLWREAAEALDAFARLTPVVLVLEDLHAGDRATNELVAYLAQRPSRARLLLLATYRPDDGAGSAQVLDAAVDSLRALRRCEHHDLAPLDEDAVATMLRARLAPASPAPELARQVHARTEGNALFATTLVDRLVDDETLVEVDGVCSAQAPIAELGIPRSVRQLITERIARFDDDDHHLLVAGAAAGMEFTSAEVVAGFAPLTESPTGSVAPNRDLRWVEQHLLRIARESGMLTEVDPVAWPDGSIIARFRFHHELVRDVLHDQLGGVQRVLVHRAIGSALEQQGAHGRREPTVVAEHFEVGRDSARAALHYARASDAVRRRLAPLEALDLARRGLAVADQPGVELPPIARLGLEMTLVSATIAAHGVTGPQITAAVAAAEAVVDVVPDPVAAGHARYLFWSIAFMAGEIRTAAARLETLERSAASGAADDLLALEIENARTLTSFAAGAPVAALAHAARYRRLELRAAANGHEHAAQDFAMVNRASEALASWIVGRTDDARRIAHEGVQIARRIGSPETLCRCLWPVATMHQLQGERDLVSRCADEIRSLAETSGAPRWLLVADLFGGWAGGAGAAELRAALDGLIADGMGFARPYHIALVADAALAAGELDAALAAAGEAIATSETTGDRCYLAEQLRIRAVVLLELAARESRSRRAALEREADELLAEAAAVAHEQGAWALERRVAATRQARAARRVGRRLVPVAPEPASAPPGWGPAAAARARA